MCQANKINTEKSNGLLENREICRLKSHSAVCRAGTELMCHEPATLRGQGMSERF